MAEQLNAIRMADAIRERLADFTASDMFVRDPKLSANMRCVWAGKGDDGGLLSDLWVEGAFPSVPSRNTLDTLVSEGVVCKGLRDLLVRNKKFPADRYLYAHQSESLRAATAGYEQEHKPAIVVTAGTGAGKTESFLLPMLNDLFRHAPRSGEGVSAIILYPMNALVNDQVDRLYRWLKGQRDLTLFNFTSETPEDKRAADRAGTDYWDVCRIRTRQEARMQEEWYNDKHEKQGMRHHVPRILVTNYSMLEYMLCRPQDNVFFGKNLRTLVLDEAHLYTGVLATEITLLQRRLLLRCCLNSSDVLQFATSATLGKADDLKPFAAKLFSKDETSIQVIVGEQKKPALPPISKGQMPSMEDICSGRWPQEKEVLSATPLVHSLVDRLWDKKLIRLSELSANLFPAENSERAEEATRVLLGLCALTRKNIDDFPILPNRIHFLFRGAQGFTVFFDSIKRKNGFAWNGWTVVPGYFERCPETGVCGLSLARCNECGKVFFHAVMNRNKGTLTAAPPLPRDDNEDDEDKERETPKEIFLAATKDASDGMTSMEYVFNPATGKYGGHGSKGVTLREVVSCWHCNADKRAFRAFVTFSSLIRNIAAEAALAELPPKATADAAWLPARGRRLLAFSDSRSSAAKLGPSLSRQHNRQIIRALIVRGAPIVDRELIEVINEEIQDVRTKLSRDVTSVVRTRLERQLQEKKRELRQYTVGGSVAEWLDILKMSPLVSEVFDAEQSGEHTHTKWSQREWEKHSEHIRENILPLRFMSELALRPRWPQIALETLGLIEVVYPGLEELSCPDTLIGLLPPVLSEFFKANWAAFSASILDSLRTDGAVTFGDYGLDKRYNEDRPYIALGKWFSLENSFSPWLIALKGKDSNRHRRNAFVQSLIRKAVSPAPDQSGLDRWTSLVFENLFNQLAEKATNTLSWLAVADKQSGENSSVGTAKALQINFPKLALRTPLKLFRCATTGQVWPRSVAGDAPARVRLDLKPVTPEELDQDARLGRQRREYRESKLFEIGIWGDEHSAQLTPHENRRLQDLFRVGLRNLLSSTTTLELGIDIGGLNAVLMANLPPGKANYLQRAGRAGRRADGSSAVIGFARPSAYEQEVFKRFDHYLDSPLRRPNVFLDRTQIVERHWNAFLLGEFYRTLSREETGTMTAYGRMGWFCNLTTVPYWDKSSKPDENSVRGQKSGLTLFVEFLNKARTDTSVLAEFDAARTRIRAGCGGAGALDGSIPELLDAAAKRFTDALAPWRKDYEEILKAWKDTVQPRFANKLYHQLKLLSEITVIETLANCRVLPRYGFPIDLHALKVVASEQNNGGDFRLERKSLQALREYVPGSKVIAGNRTVTSHGILKHGVGERALGLSGQLATCVNGHSFYTITPSVGNCPYCGEGVSGGPKNLLLPRNGYTTAEWDKPDYRYEPHVVSYRCPVHVQLHELTQSVTDFGGVSGLSVSWFKDGEILAIHDGVKGKGFAICTKCGFADSEDDYGGTGRIGFPNGFSEHAALANPNPLSHCWKDEDAPVLRNITLAAQQTTELLLLDFSPWLFKFGVPPHDAIIAAVAAALKLSGARLLEIDARELGMIDVFPAGENGTGLGVLLYDDIPGGCGHVRDLMESADDWLRAARDLLYVNAPHHKACLHGCIDCILSAFFRETVIQPDRCGAYDLLNALLSGQQWQAPRIEVPQTVIQAQLPLHSASKNSRVLKQRLQSLISSNSAMPFEKKVWKTVLEQLKEGRLSEQEIAEKLAEL